MTHRFTNWAHTHSCRPEERHVPDGEEQLAEIVLSAAARKKRVRVVGAGHSWSDIACSDEIQISLDGLSRLLSVDKEQRVVTVEGGMRVRELNQLLAEHGLALDTLGSVSEQSVAGVISTGTHGSGLGHKIIAANVLGLRLLTADGSFHDATEGSDLLLAARVGLGSLGVITRVTLRCVDAFNLEECGEPMTFDEALETIPTLLPEADFLKYWWIPHTDYMQVFRSERSQEPTNLSAFALWFDEAIVNRFVFASLLWIGATLSFLVPLINKVVRLAYFKVSRRIGRSDHILNLAMPPRHQEMEYSIPVEHAARALRATRELIESKGLRVNFIVELRFVAADDSWLSPAYERDSCYVGAYIAGGPHEQLYLDEFEKLMLSLGGRPHWGKEFKASAEALSAAYPKMADFVRLRDELDPQRMFSNAYAERVFGA